jgi:hypothetical protein
MSATALSVVISLELDQYLARETEIRTGTNGSARIVQSSVLLVGA